MNKDLKAVRDETLQVSLKIRKYSRGKADIHPGRLVMPNRLLKY